MSLRKIVKNQSKKVLFIGLKYHDYTSAIINEIQSYGFNVDYIDIQPRSFLFKVFRTISPKGYQVYLDFYHRRAIQRRKDIDYEIVFFLQAHQFSIESLGALKQVHKNAKFILYNWDSLDNHNYLPQAHLFDEVFTFDPLDADKHNFNYLPLFSTRFMQSIESKASQLRSVYMIGNIVNPTRYEAVQKFSEYCKTHGIKFTTYLAITPVVYLKMILAGCWPKNVYFSSISKNKFVSLVEESQAVFDFSNHHQSGYTMRVIENICSGKKIITNNFRLSDEEYFIPNQVFCYKNFDFTGVADFLDIPVVDIEDRYEKLKIQSFVATLLGLYSLTPSDKIGSHTIRAS